MTKSLQALPLSQFPFTPSTYPGRRPRFSFLFTTGGLYRINVRNLNATLASRGLAPVNERYAILAYGSNACPGQLKDKALTDVPVLFGRLTGAQAVYAKRQTQRGYVPATLAEKPGSLWSWVTFLTAEQLRTMDKSEGRPNFYVLAKLRKARFFVGRFQARPLYTYVEIRGGVMIVNGAPVSLRNMGQRRAKSLLATATSGNATDWLEFDTIADLNHPLEFSTILRSLITNSH